MASVGAIREGLAAHLRQQAQHATAVQEGIKMTVVLLDNHGFSSIGGLSAAVGCGGFATEYRCRTGSGALDGEHVHVDFAANAASLGAKALVATDAASLRRAVAESRAAAGTTVIVVPVDRNARVSGYESWWDVPVAEVSHSPEVQGARAAYEVARRKERDFL